MTENNENNENKLPTLADQINPPASPDVGSKSKINN